MKNLYALFFGLLCSAAFSISTSAQAPQAFSYQAVAIGDDGTVLANQSIAVQVNVRADSNEGTIVYSETHAATTTAAGLFNLEIGFGTPTTGTLDAVDWGSAFHFLEVAVDENGGTNYEPIGLSQLLSVPYALYAASGPQGPQGEEGPQGPQGDAGPQGPAGAVGAAGPQGPTGTTGSAGPAGPAGPAGAQGPAGPAGPTGSAGPAGPAGPTGAQGPQGPMGEPGPDGNPGPQGPPGSGGGINCWDTNGDAVNSPNEDINNDGQFTALDCKGPQGPAGPTGVGGGPGPAGPMGEQGFPGAQGPQGESTPWTQSGGVVSYNDGNVGIGTSAPACKLDVSGDVCSNGVVLSSDARYKKDIVQLALNLDQINALRGVRYHFNTTKFPERNFPEVEQIGLIAQEVEALFPELVTTKPDGYKAVDYAKLTPILLEAIKLLDAELDTKEATFNAQFTDIQKQINSLQVLLQQSNNQDNK